MRKQHEKPIRLKDKKQCTQCKTFKPFSDFHKYAKSSDGHKHFCKVCVREYDQKEDDPKRKMPRKKSGDLIHCRKCEQYLAEDKFPKLRKNGKYITYTYCLECDNLIGHLGNLKKYGLTRDEYVDLEKSQNGVCKICGNPEPNRKRLSIDHDHACCPGAGSCGKCIRGLLCFQCNAALGSAKDDVKLLARMIEYLNGN